MKPNRLIFPLFVVLITAFTLSSVRAADFTAADETELISAINASNDEATNPGLDVITLTSNIVLTGELPAFASEITIEGSRFTLERDVNAAPFRILLVNSTGNLIVSKLTIRNGMSDTGGGLLILQGGFATLNDTVFNANSATISGGAVQNDASFSLLNGVIYGNSAPVGAGLYNGDAASILNTTFSANTASTAGGAIYNVGEMFIDYSTLFGNTAPLGGGIHTESGFGITIIRDSIVTASGAGGDCTNDGGNYMPSNSLATGLCGTTPVTNIDPILADNGGNTLTHALLEGSNAINGSGDCSLVLNTPVDQRSYLRDSQCDIGAFEFMGTPPTNTPVPPTASATQTATLDPNMTPTETPAVTATVDTTQTTTTPQSTSTETPTETQTAAITPTSDAVTFTPTPSATASPTRTPDPGTELLLNGGFETNDNNDKVPDEWKVKNPTKDKLKCNKAGKIVAFEGECAFMFKGGAAENSRLQHKVALDTAALISGDIITLSAQVNAAGDDISGDISVTIVFNDPVLDQLKITLDIVPTDGYALLTQSRLLFTSNISKIKVKISHKSGKGKVFVDAVSLLKQANPNALLPLPQ